jgi:nucleotide-binding universal stress UspA family protein
MITYGEARSWLEAIGVPASAVTVRRGTPWVELVRVAEDRGAKVIVVGTHGRSGFQPIALGSTATRIALLSPRPTVLVGDHPARAAAWTAGSNDVFENHEA